MNSLVEASERGNRLTQLTELRRKLAEAIDDCESKRDLAALSRQYRETLKEIEELEEYGQEEDEIKEILELRASNGMPGATRRVRSGTLSE